MKWTSYRNQPTGSDQPEFINLSSVNVKLDLVIWNPEIHNRFSSA